MWLNSRKLFGDNKNPVTTDLIDKLISIKGSKFIMKELTIYNLLKPIICIYWKKSLSEKIYGKFKKSALHIFYYWVVF